MTNFLYIFRPFFYLVFPSSLCKLSYHSVNQYASPNSAFDKHGHTYIHTNTPISVLVHREIPSKGSF